METALTACEWNSASYLIFSPNVISFIYYTHFLPLIISLLMGGFVLYNNWRGITNRILFFITAMFSIWVYFDLILWASPTPEDVIFFWSSIVPIEMLIYAGCLYLVYVFANGERDISLDRKIAISIFFIPIVLFTHTSYNVLGLSPDCDTGAIEGPLIQYMYVVELFFIIWASAVIIKGLRSLKTNREKTQLLLIGLGTIAFLISFTAGNITLIFSLNPDWEQYKLFGMPIFAAFVAYLIVRFRAFNSKLIATQVLVAALSISVLSLLFLRSIVNVRIVAGITVIFVVAVGYLLVRSVKREIEQREHIEKLAGELAQINERQETLLHFIGHEVKGFLTKDMSAFAAISQGDFGAPPDGMKPFVETALAESRRGADSVGNILKASNLKKGAVTYLKAPFDLKVSAAEAVEKARPAAEQKGLALTFAAADASYQMTGDKAQLSDHVLRNLIDNAVNYTPSGSVAVSLERTRDKSLGKDKIIFKVKDTGIGITEEDKKRLFTEGGHGRDSQRVNAHSTGYGLYIAKQITEAHGGIVRAESEGQGKGSAFVVEFPST